MEQILFWLVPVSSVLALGFAWYFYRQMMKESEGTPQMMKIAAAVRKGAMSYLKQQYKIVGLVFLGLVVMFSIMAYGFGVQNSWVPVAFLTGGFFSGLAGYLGMKTATYASARTANAARNSLNAGLRIAFRSGAVMGLVVVGLGLLDISFWYLLLNAVIPEDVLMPTHKLCIITTTMLTFGMGASTQALFARVGGGIYTKAADVGADLVGKVEAGIPEDDPRNPATIADNVGDNVGDVAGMGADLYESYCGSILSTAALGASAFMFTGDTVMQFKAVIAPMLIAAVGILLSIAGIFAVRTREGASMKNLLAALSRGHQPELAAHCGGHFPHPVAAGTGQLAGHRRLGSGGPAGGRHHWALHGVLYLAVLPPHPAVERKRQDGACHGHHLGHRAGHALHSHSCHHGSGGRDAVLHVCRRL